jgi:hypothetical protein
MRSLVGRAKRAGSRSLVEQLASLTSSGDGSTLSLDFTTGVLDPRLSFTRTTNATFINSQGYVQYADANLVLNSTMLVSTAWTANTSGGGTVTINNDNTVTFASTAGRATWLQSITIQSGLPVTFSIEVTALTNTNIRVSDLFQAGTGFTSQVYNYTDLSGNTTANIGAFTTLPGVGLYTVNATTTATSGNVIFGTDCNGVTRTGSVTIARPQLQYGTRVSSRVYLANSSTSAANTNTPRFDYDPTTRAPRGLLFEGDAVNYVLRSDVTGFSSPWSTAGTNLPTVTAGYTGGGFSPDGITYPTRLQFGVNAGGSASRLLQATTYATNPTTANPYTVSVWMKSNTAGTNYTVNIYGTTGNNLVTVTPTWQRFQVVNTSGTSLVGYIYISNESTSIAADVSIWGAQLEAGSGASSYIPTGASQGSRTADSCVMNDITPLQYSNTNGSIYWSGIFNKQPLSYITLIGFMTAVDQPSYETFGNALNYFTAARGASLSTGGANEVSRPYTLGSLTRYASAVNTVTDPIVRVNLNGSAGSITKGGSGDLYAATRFVIGRNPSTTYGNTYPSITITQIKYWPVTKTAAELNSLTTT